MEFSLVVTGPSRLTTLEGTFGACPPSPLYILQGFWIQNGAKLPPFLAVFGFQKNRTLKNVLIFFFGGGGGRCGYLPGCNFHSNCLEI